MSGCNYVFSGRPEEMSSCQGNVYLRSGVGSYGLYPFEAYQVNMSISDIEDISRCVFKDGMVVVDVNTVIPEMNVEVSFAPALSMHHRCQNLNKLLSQRELNKKIARQVNAIVNNTIRDYLEAVTVALSSDDISNQIFVDSNIER
jgi:hypothetical protein